MFAGEITKMKAGRQAPRSVATLAGYTRKGGKAGAEKAEGLEGVRFTSFHTALFPAGLFLGVNWGLAE